MNEFVNYNLILLYFDSSDNYQNYLLFSSNYEEKLFILNGR